MKLAGIDIANAIFKVLDNLEETAKHMTRAGVEGAAAVGVFPDGSVINTIQSRTIGKYMTQENSQDSAAGSALCQFIFFRSLCQFSGSEKQG